MRSIEPGISLGVQSLDSGFDTACRPGMTSRYRYTATRPFFARIPTVHGVVFEILSPDPKQRPQMRNCASGTTYVLLPAAVATTGNTSLAARSGVSSFQRTEPNGRSSMRRTRIGSGPIWKSIAR